MDYSIGERFFALDLDLADRPAKIPVSINSTCNPGKSEFLLLQSAFDEICKGDPRLSKKLNTHFPIFLFDHPKLGEMQLTSSMRMLPNVDIFRVRFAFRESPIRAAADVPSTSSSFEAQKSSSSRCISSGFDEMDNSSTQPILIEFSSAAYEEDGIGYLSPNVPQVEFVDVPEVDQPNLVVAPAASASSLGKDRRVLAIEDITMPTLTAEVQEMIETGKMLHNSSKFIKIVSLHLLSLKQQPTPKDYQTYVSFLLKTYPNIMNSDIHAKNDEDFASLKRVLAKTISTFVRNYRHRVIKGNSLVTDDDRQRGSIVAVLQRDTNGGKKRKSNEKDDVGSPIEKKQLGEDGATTNIHGQEERDDILHFLKVKDADAHKIVELLPSCFDFRREKIKECSTVLEVANQYPMLVNYEVIKAEFFFLCGLPHFKVMDNFNNMILQLGEMFEQPSQLDGEKLEILVKLHKELEDNKYASKNYTAALSVYQLSDDDLVSPENIESNGPVCVCYVDTKGGISDTFLLAEGRELNSAKDLDAFGVYVQLAGAYYCFNSTYPPYSKNFLDFLDCAVLQKKNKNQAKKYLQFKKRFYAKL